MPYFPTNYTAVAGTAVSSNTTGDIKSHTHVVPGASHSHNFYCGTTNVNTVGTGAAINYIYHIEPAGNHLPGGTMETTPPNSDSQSTGGSANLPAGITLLFCVKYL